MNTPNNPPDRILIVDDDPHMRSALSLSIKKTGAEGDIFASAEEALNFIGNSAVNGNYFLILSDLSLPGMDGISFLNEIKKLDAFKFIPFVIITAYGTVESAVSAMKLGAADYLLKPFDITDFERIVKNAEKLSAMLKIGGTGERNGKAAAQSDFIYESAKMKEIDSYINITAQADATVLITGESGTGKEVVAKRIHNLSKRKGKFIGVNCSAIVSTLLESELFGHEKGAFTGAVSLKKGKFEQADNGTILLDEIAEMDKNLQAKILRSLQEKTIDRVGGNEPVAVNARVIAATNKDIEKAVSEGIFRDDLFYRLNVIRLHMPPLRERKEDILPLAKYFMKRYAKKYFRDCKKITREAQDYLLSLNYPGNIRELENIMERAVILAQKDEAIDIAHFRGFNSPLYNYVPAAIADSAVPPAAAGIQNTGNAVPAKAVPPSQAEKPQRDLTMLKAGSEAGKELHISSPASSEKHCFSAGEDAIRCGSEAVIQNNFATLSIKEMEEKLIAAALKETNGNRTKAAEKLGITARTLRNKLKEYNLKDY